MYASTSTLSSITEPSTTSALLSIFETSSHSTQPKVEYASDHDRLKFEILTSRDVSSSSQLKLLASAYSGSSSESSEEGEGFKCWYKLRGEAIVIVK